MVYFSTLSAAIDQIEQLSNKLNITKELDRPTVRERRLFRKIQTTLDKCLDKERNVQNDGNSIN